MFVDSSAWFEYFSGGRRGTLVRTRMDGSETLLSSSVVLAELCSKYVRSGEAGSVDARMAFIQKQCAVIEITAEIGLAAGRIHAEEKAKKGKFSLADALVLATARSRASLVLTFDADFSGLDDAIVLDAP